MVICPICFGLKDEMAFLDTFEAFSLRIEDADLEFESREVNENLSGHRFESVE